MTGTRKGKRFHVSITRDWCKGCSICVAFCQTRVLGIGGEEKAVVLQVEACTGCRLCELRCPDSAITVKAADGVLTGDADAEEDARAPIAVYHEGLNAVQTQSYGPEARGGSARADVIIATSPNLFPKVLQPNVLVCLSQLAYDKYAWIVRPGGVVAQRFDERHRERNLAFLALGHELVKESVELY